MKFSTLSLSAGALALSLAGCGGETAEADTTSLLAEGGAASTDPVTAENIDYGNDTSQYANDGECDDMRFEGAAMASGLIAENIGKDATDCRADAEAGRIAVNELFNQPDNYGDDTGEYANDDECDDIRFAVDYADRMFYVSEDIGHDATDCRNDMESGSARWQGATATPEFGLTLEEAQARFEDNGFF